MPDFDALLRPGAIALIGASPIAHIIRGRLLDALTHCGYPGQVYPVSRTHESIDGVRCYESVDAIPVVPDLAVIAVPAEHVASVLEQCAVKGVRAAVIISSGFAEEPGDGGRERQRQISDICARHDLAVLGPNGEGFANTLLPLVASFSPAVHGYPGPLLPPEVRAGRIAVTSQSGGMGFAFFDEGRSRNVPFSYVVSMGNEAGLESLDVATHLVDNDDVQVLLMFLEGFRTPSKLDTLAHKAFAARKPVVIAKVGRGEAARAGAAAHTASIAGSDDAYRAAFHRHGITLAGDLREAVDLATAFAFHAKRLPASKRVGILTPSGGAGIWLADVCERAGLEVPELDPDTRAALEALMPAYGASRNPVDITAQALAGPGYHVALTTLARSPRVDTILVASSLVRPGALDKEADELARLAKECRKPIIFISYTRPAIENVETLARAGIPCLTEMPNAAAAVNAMVAWREFLERGLPLEHRPSGALPSAPLADAPDGLIEHHALELLQTFGVDIPPARLVESEDAAADAARELGYPVVLKVQSVDLPHKSDAGALALGLSDEGAVRDAYRRITRSAAIHAPSARIDGVRVQPMADSGVEMIVGVQHDSDFGPLVVVGTGGIFVEILADAAMAPAPITDDEARRLISRLEGSTLLAGARGRPAADVDALARLLVSVGEFAACCDGRLESLDLNPVIVHAAGDGLTVADALIVTRPWKPDNSKETS